MAEAVEPVRLFLVTPPAMDLAEFPARLGEALNAAEVAAVLIVAAEGEPASERMASALLPIIQAAGAAGLIADHTRVAGRLKADGVQVGTGLGDLRSAIETFRPKRIVGAGNIHSRHSAMEAGELGADYLFFGRPHGDTHDDPHPKALDLAEWWSELAQVPAVVMAGRSLGSIREAAMTGAEFVALGDAIWSYEEGPAAAVRKAAAVLGLPERAAA